jgi:Family of unknown function (DUF6134)
MTEDGIGMRAYLWTYRAAVFYCAALVVVMVGGFSPVCEAAAPMQLTYRVTHSVYGDIGTYINTIEPSAGGTTTVRTRAHFEVKMLGIKMYSEDAQRTERWQGNRLIWFSGVTEKHGAPMVIRGEARGNNFIISSPEGTITAPGNVHPANPWSANFLYSNTMMRVDDGKIEKVRISGGEPVVLNLDGRSVRAQKYDVNGATRYEVWIDSKGVPVMFVVDEDSGKITFTLTSCTICDLAVAQQVGLK